MRKLKLWHWVLITLMAGYGFGRDLAMTHNRADAAALAAQMEALS